MSAPIETAVIGGIVFLAALIRSTIGFGEALIAMPLLAFLIPAHVAAPLVALCAFVNGISILVREWRHVRFSSAVRLIAPALVAIPLGVWLLRSGDDRIVKGLLAAVIIAFSTWSLMRRHQVRLHNDRWAPLAGLIAGFLGGAYNTSGPPLVMYATLRRWPAEQFRGILQSYFTVTGLWILSMHTLGGLMTRDVLTRFGICLPLILIATSIGPRISRRLSAERFISVVHVALLAIGALLLVNLLWPLRPTA